MSANQVITGMGPSRTKKAELKGLFYPKNLALVEGDGVSMQIVDLTIAGSNPQLNAQSAQTMKAIKISATASGYTGDVTASGVGTFSYANGILVDFTPEVGV